MAEVKEVGPALIGNVYTVVLSQRNKEMLQLEGYLYHLECSRGSITGVCIFCLYYREKTPVQSGVTASVKQKYLIIFDFDETIINENSDDSVIRAAPGGTLPDWLRNSLKDGFYNEYMQHVFEYLGEQGVQEEAIRNEYSKIPLSPGMLNIFNFLMKNSGLFEIILISDANMFGIEATLKAIGFHSLFRKIYTNPAHFDKRGYLVLRPYHSHTCTKCPANMCKRKIVTEYLTERAQQSVKFEKMLYVGDGANDFCPTVVFSSNDVAFPRKNYPMHRRILEMQKSQPNVYQPTVIPWQSADDVIYYLQRLLQT
ncbi:phosphoethanolamine/phosphocholine phosphatase [Protopterus annectens]|uniref:phosphoethanolamine/phosphocholine phosphatase n=1 Tax=Protopterus annectens TaxID=7888 RepID=UPI001CFA3DDE|nr:phosphoethanolamine/phosphocholine phosphatase [Protopterus annectens]